MDSPPPYYVLVSHSSVASTTPGAPSSNFSHPIIQYHYQDDSALPLLPQHPDEHVIVIDYDPSSKEIPAIKSISHNLVVKGLKVDEAPGASAADGRNNHMFVIETTSDDQIQNSHVSPHATLAHFKQRNAILRQALNYPQGSQQIQETSNDSHPELGTSPNA